MQYILLLLLVHLSAVRSAPTLYVLICYFIAYALGCEIRPEINVSDRNFGCYGK